MALRKCKKSICVEKKSYNITLSTLDKLYEDATKLKQDAYLEIFIKIKDNDFYRLNCKIEKISI